MTCVRWIRRLVWLGALMSGLAGAQTPAPAAPAADDSLFQALGGNTGLVKLMDDFMVRLLADKRMNPFFKDTNQQHVKDQLVAQVCELSGGPCKLKGPNMKQVHAEMDIARGDFNALVEVLQDAMDANGITFSAQNRLLARLAPMNRDIITKP
jgi:hemoglobin